MKNAVIKSLLLIGLGFTVITSGYTQKYRMHESYVKKVNFIDSVDYRVQDGYLIVEADPEKTGKKYAFIFDSCSPTVLSKNVAQEVGLVHEGNLPTYLHHQNAALTSIGTLNYIQISGIEFESVSCYNVSANFFSAKGFENIVGIIGANLMNACVWQIVPTRKKIIIASAKSYLKVPVNANKVKIKLTKGVCTPIIKLNYANAHFEAELCFHQLESLSFSNEIVKKISSGILQMGKAEYPVENIQSHQNPQNHYISLGALGNRTVTLDFIIEKLYVH